MNAESKAANFGTVVSVRGGVVDVRFNRTLPPIYSVLRDSAVVTLIALVRFGGIKTRCTGIPIIRGALQTTVIGRPRCRRCLRHRPLDFRKLPADFCRA